MSVNSGKKMDHNLSFSSRRSPVVCLHGSVASSQPLATDIGLGEFTCMLLCVCGYIKGSLIFFI